MEATKPKRSNRIHFVQYEKMVEYAEQHRCIQTNEPSDTRKDILQRMAEELNSFGVGPTKTWTDWKIALIHWRSVVRAKARQIIEDPQHTIPLNPIEARLMAVFGTGGEEQTNNGNSSSVCSSVDPGSSLKIKTPKKPGNQRGSRITHLQYEKMVDYVEQHGCIRTNGKGDRDTYEKTFRRMAKELNSVGFGTTKTWPAWRRALTHWKAVVRTKQRRILNGEADSKHRRIILNHTEARLLAAYGKTEAEQCDETPETPDQEQSSSDSDSEEEQNNSSSGNRITRPQYEKMIEYVEQHRCIRTNGKGDRDTYEKTCQRMAEELNSFGFGPTKTWTAWRIALTHWKAVVRTKQRRIIKLNRTEARLMAAYGRTDEEQCDDEREAQSDGDMDDESRSSDIIGAQIDNMLRAFRAEVQSDGNFIIVHNDDDACSATDPEKSAICQEMSALNGKLPSDSDDEIQTTDMLMKYFGAEAHNDLNNADEFGIPDTQENRKPQGVPRSAKDSDAHQTSILRAVVSQLQSITEVHEKRLASERKNTAESNARIARALEEGLFAVANSVRDMRAGCTTTDPLSGVVKSEPMQQESTTDSDDEPLAKRYQRAEPGNAEIEIYVRKVLQNSNLYTFTMNNLVDQVSKHFRQNLVHKKKFMKEIVQSALA